MYIDGRAVRDRGNNRSTIISLHMIFFSSINIIIIIIII